jgi:hypothetical protein
MGMTQQELACRNVGQNLDDLMNLDPRGYGVCRILYPAARARMGAPLSTAFAKGLMEAVRPGDLVYILTGFVLLPHGRPEMDGIVGAALLARALAAGLAARPVLVVPEGCLEAARKLAAAVGLHCYDVPERLETLREMPVAMGLARFPVDAAEAERAVGQLTASGLPAAVIATEAPAANRFGIYHNARGLDVTALEAKSDVLFRALQGQGVPAFAIGDLGNEIGLGALRDGIGPFIPHAASDLGPACILADTEADWILTATVSDWGANAVIAALAYLLGDMEILHERRVQEAAMVAASAAGMVDMTGWLQPAIDGFNLEMNTTILELMRQCTAYALGYPQRYRDGCGYWFDGVLGLGYFDREAP